MTPDEIVRRAREENARKEKEETAKKEVFDRIFEKFKDGCWKAIQEDVTEPEEIDRFEEEMERLQKEAWDAVNGEISQDELQEVEEDLDDFLDFFFEELDNKEDLQNELLQKIKNQLA